MDRGSRRSAHRYVECFDRCAEGARHAGGTGGDTTRGGTSVCGVQGLTEENATMMNETRNARSTNRNLETLRSDEWIIGADSSRIEAVEAWARAGARRLLGVAHLYLRDKGASEQVVRDVLLKALRAVSQGDLDAASEMRLRQQTLALSLRRVRERARRSEAELEHLMPRFRADGTRASASTGRGRAGAVERKDEQIAETMREHIGRLPELHRTVLILTNAEGLDTGSIAIHLELSESRVRKLLHEARLALCTLLNPQMQDRAVEAERPASKQTRVAMPQRYRGRTE
jgi:DNA-directed RNA polymerase specialized sigma24 family protein